LKLISVSALNFQSDLTASGCVEFYLRRSLEANICRMLHAPGNSQQQQQQQQSASSAYSSSYSILLPLSLMQQIGL
jgi:hypothetical protein